MKKIKEFDKQKIMVYIIAAFIVFWNIASILGIIAFFRTNNENRAITASAAERQQNYTVPFVDERISLPFLDGSIVPTKLNVGGISQTVVNLARTQWRFSNVFKTQATAGYGEFQVGVSLTEPVSGSANLISAYLRVGYQAVDSVYYPTANYVCGNVNANYVIAGVPQFGYITFSFDRGGAEDESNPMLIDWLYQNCSLVSAPSDAYEYDESDTVSWYNLSTFAFKPINSTSMYFYDTFTEETLTVTTDDALGKTLYLSAYSSLSDLTIQRPRMLVFMYSNTITDFENAVPLGYDLKLKNISAIMKGFVVDVRYFTIQEGVLTDAGTLSIGLGFYTDAQAFILPYIHRILDASYWDNMPNIDDEYPLGMYSFHSANNVAYYLDTNEEIQYWIDQYNALLRNYNNAYSKGETAGYQQGYDVGYGVGKSAGYSQGLSDSNQYSFESLLTAVIDVPINSFTSLFNFDFLGVNLANFFLSLLTVCIIITVVRLLL